jgi:hypothetical protein
MAGDYLTTDRRKEMRRMFRHHYIHISPLLSQQAEDTEGFESRNATGNGQNRLSALE